MNSRVTRILLWSLALALLLASLRSPPPRAPRSTPFLLFGPFLELAAELQWMRFQSARFSGQEARALELAESALRLDPSSTEGWQMLAAHLALDLASEEREPDLARRRRWFEAGMGVLTRGAEQAAHPEELELFRGLVLFGKAEADPGLVQGGAPALFAAAGRAFERAAELGAKQARELLPYVRERALLEAEETARE